MVTNFSAMLMRIGSAGVPPAVVTACSGLGEIDDSPSLIRLRDGMAIVRRVPARRVEFQLPLNVVQQPAGAEPEAFRLHPRQAQLFLHHSQPLGRLPPG